MSATQHTTMLEWRDTGDGVWHGFDANGFCGAVWEGNDGRWYPRTRNADGTAAHLKPRATAREATRSLELWRKGNC